MLPDDNEQQKSFIEKSESAVPFHDTVKQNRAEPHHDTTFSFSRLIQTEMNSQEMISKLEDLIRLTLECEKKEIKSDVVFIETYKKLIQIQKSLHVLEQSQKQTMQVLADIAKKEHILPAADDEEVMQETTKLCTKIQSLTQLCEAARDRVHAVMAQNPDVQKATLEKIKDSMASEEKKQARRKNKFRSVGGKQGWIPL